MGKFIFILSILLFYSCTKDKTVKKIDQNDCEDFSSSWSSPLEPSYFEIGNQMEAPFFNPNNPNEFIYSLRNNETQECKLMKYDITTKQKNEILNDFRILNQAKWSTKGWISFVNLQDYQVYLVKENGDSLRQFSSNNNNYFPTWSFDGNYLFRQYTPTSGTPYYLLKQGLYSNTVDTVFKDYGHFNEISNVGKIISKIYRNGKSQIAISDANTINYSEVINLDDLKLIGLEGLTWSNDGKTAYFTIAPNGYNFGLFKIDVSTKILTKLIDFCDSKRYTTISCSSIGKTLIAERKSITRQVNSNNDYTGNYFVNSSIYLIDLETLSETKINLD